MSVGGSFMFNLKHNLLRSRFEGKGLLYVQFKKDKSPKTILILEPGLFLDKYECFLCLIAN